MAALRYVFAFRFRTVTSVYQKKVCLTDFSKYSLSTSVENENINDSSSENSNNNRINEDDIKVSILNAALEFIPEHGWSRYALSAGAEKLGYPGVAHGMFPDGGAELVHHFYFTCNRDLEKQLKSEEFLLGENTDITSSNREQLVLRKALEIRLRLLIPYLNKWPQAMAIMAMPQNAPTALKNLMDLTDTIWFHAGDKSVDLSWYGKRFALATIYKTTELCLLQDSSPDYNTTWLFLDRRMADFTNTRRYAQQMQEGREISSELITGGLSVVRNILGLGRINR